jgi:hypothetical protein
MSAHGSRPCAELGTRTLEIAYQVLGDGAIDVVIVPGILKSFAARGRVVEVVVVDVVVVGRQSLSTPRVTLATTATSSAGSSGFVTCA